MRLLSTRRLMEVSPGDTQLTVTLRVEGRQSRRDPVPREVDINDRKDLFTLYLWGPLSLTIGWGAILFPLVITAYTWAPLTSYDTWGPLTIRGG